MKESILADKSEMFAIRIVKLYKWLCTNKKEYVMSKQLLRSGTSIGANISEARYGQSRNDFVAKIQIALKEASETAYWLRLLHKTEYISEPEYNSIYSDCDEIIKMLVATVKTTKQNS